MKKKLLTVLLIVVIVFNFICTSKVYADPDDISGGIPISNGEGQITPEQADNVIQNGTDKEGNSFNIVGAVIGTIFQVISLVLNSFPMAINAYMTTMTKNPTGSDNPLAEVASFVIEIFDVSSYFSIQRTVFNEVALFNSDVFNMSKTYTVGLGEHKQTIYQVPTVIKLKESAAMWFYSCRMLAIMINLCILIYVGIRMAISTVASEEAKYKKMLIWWAESMVLLFFLQYIMSFAIELGNLVLNIIYNLREGMDVQGFEGAIMTKIFKVFVTSAGTHIFLYSVFFWILVFIQVKFFLTYLKRTLSIMFLTIISPFITVTYPIDKMGDGKAQAFEAWIKEYIIVIAIQPIHAAIYLVFVFSAGTIAEHAPLVGLLFLLSLGRIENIVRNIFGITNSVSMKKMDDELKKPKKK